MQQIIRLEHNIITGSRYTVMPDNTPSTKIVHNTNNSKPKASKRSNNQTLHKNTRLLKQDKTTTLEFHDMPETTVHIEHSLNNDNKISKLKRKPYDKARTIARKSARMAKQALPEIMSIYESEIIDEVIKIELSPINLFANACQHIVTVNTNEVIFACDLKRANVR